MTEMTDGFLTELRLQLREAALREERRAQLARRLVRTRGRLPGLRELAGVLAAAAVAVALAIGIATVGDHDDSAAPHALSGSTVASRLSQLAPGFGAVWTADPGRKEILRIDPLTRRVVTRIPVGAAARVVVGADAIWALVGDLCSCDANPVHLVRIDPQSNRVVARIPMRRPAGEGFGPSDVQIDGSAVWVLGAEGAARVDPRRDVVQHFVRLTDASGEAPHGTVVDGGKIWTLMLDGRLRVLDGATGRVTADVRVHPAEGSFPFRGLPGMVSLIGTDEMVMLASSSGQPLWRSKLDGRAFAWTSDGHVLWVHIAREPLGRDEVVEMDAATGRKLGVVELPDGGVAGMAMVGRDVWVATPRGRVVVVGG